ncbi:MAG: NAD(P)-dependent oxidoreductase [Lachnospiraceae bacterium]|nr:NAD(P)-dependent oxidoreductase [Lachnospiraceae bacterium]
MEFQSAVITGATGVVGTALVEELLHRGIRVLALLREGSPNNDRLPAHPLLTIKNCSLDRLGTFENPSDQPWDVFYHLGWTGTKGKDRFDPYIHTENVRYALDAAALAARLGCGMFIGAGSQAEYGRVEAKLTPQALTSPENAYGIAKLCAGQMTREYCRTLGLQHVWTRILSVYGPNDGPATLVTSLINSLLQGEKPSCTEGEQIWDLLYAGDAAEALYLAAANGRNGETYLIASGQELTLRSQIECIRDAVAPGAEIGFGEKPYAPRQVMYLAADISKTTEDLGWRPHTSLREGALKTAAVMRK